jgi:hypothetical protein
VLARLQIGFDGRRLTLPVRDADHHLLAVLRYAPPWQRSGPKLLAVPGSRHGLFPAPSTIKAPLVWLTEGQPDALAAQSAGLPAVAVPGVWSWDPRWAGQLAGRDSVICFDCDAPGRNAAKRVASDLAACSQRVRIVDL